MIHGTYFTDSPKDVMVDGVAPRAMRITPPKPRLFRVALSRGVLAWRAERPRRGQSVALHAETTVRRSPLDSTARSECWRETVLADSPNFSPPASGGDEPI